MAALAAIVSSCRLSNYTIKNSQISGQKVITFFTHWPKGYYLLHPMERLAYGSCGNGREAR
jgi:hypothetical protein